VGTERVDQWPASDPTAAPVVKGLEDGLVEGHGPLVAELADRHSEPGAVVGAVDDTVEFEIEQLARAQTGAAQDLHGAARDGVVELVDGGHEVAVAVGAQHSGNGFGEAWQVAAMDKRPGRSLRPSPQGEVIDERLIAAIEVQGLALAERHPLGGGGKGRSDEYTVVAVGAVGCHPMGMPVPVGEQ